MTEGLLQWPCVTLAASSKREKRRQIIWLCKAVCAEAGQLGMPDKHSSISSIIHLSYFASRSGMLLFIVSHPVSCIWDEQLFKSRQTDLPKKKIRREGQVGDEVKVEIKIHAQFWYKRSSLFINSVLLKILTITGLVVSRKFLRRGKFDWWKTPIRIFFYVFFSIFSNKVLLIFFYSWKTFITRLPEFGNEGIGYSAVIAFL